MMKRVSKEDYREAIEELVEFCGKSRHKENIVAVYLGGSVARGDFSPGRSDIDIYVVVSGRKKEIEEELREAARRISAGKLGPLFEVHQDPIGIAVTTLSEIRAGRSFLAAGFEYHNFIKTGKLLWGHEIKPLIPKPSREEERAMAKRALKQVCALLSKCRPPVDEQNRERITYGLFSTIFRTACIALCGQGRYVSGKGEVVSAFCEVYPQEHKLHEILSQSFILWKEWEKRALNEEEMQQLRKFSLEFIPRICELWNVAKG